MADSNKEAIIRTRKKSEDSNTSKKETKKAEPLKPYIHIDTFLQTAVPLFGLNSMQASGFKALMNGRHYQRDEQVFVEELKAYLNLK